MLTKSVVLTLFACGACREPPLCDPELKLNTTYVATVLEIYSQQSSAYYDSRFAQTDIATWPSCGGFDGLISGATISVKTTDTYLAGSCRELEGIVLSLPNGEGWDDNFNSRLGGGFNQYNIFSATGDVVSGACLGAYKVTFGRPVAQASIFATTKSGELPSMVLGRSFRPNDSDAGSNCTLCADTFVAQLAVGK